MATAKHDAPPTAKGASSSFSIFVSILFVAISAIISSHITSSILEQEYKKIFAEIQRDYHRSQNEYVTYRSAVLIENQNIRACQEYVVRNLGEIISAYKVGSDGLSKAMNRTRQCEVKQQELGQSNTRMEAMSTTLANSNKILNQEVEALEKERAKITRQLQNSLNDLETAEKELELRDYERTVCDTNHRALITCEETLTKSIARDRVNSDEASYHLLDQIQALKEQGKRKEEMLEEMGFAAINAEKDIQFWKMKAQSMVEKINFRSRRSVLKQYGPGPHYVRMTLSFSASLDTSENLLLKLAPLDMMPHTIQIFMNLIQEKMYVGGTFVLARDHILVAGPMDTVDPENNRRLEEQMVQEGYMPEGALLFQQYTPDFPHRQYTVGFTSSGGPLFYINIEDNTEAHGPRHIEGEGDVEGDPVFATIVEGFDVIQKILDMPRNENESLGVQIVDTYVMKTQH
jgi:cyclophilin family peptidyl-prolyl cis-trans isomerase